MWVVVDHLTGKRRGQRQEFEIETRISIGRHPDCDVSFDTHRDLEASTRHAEIRVVDAAVILRDVGSSNGTHIDGERISEHALIPSTPVEVEFGAAGPKLRIWWDPTLPPSAAGALARRTALPLWLIGLLVALVALVALTAIAIAVGLKE